MTILFTCPHCGARTEVEDHYAGQSGPCATCGKTIRIPDPLAPVLLGKPDHELATARSRSPLLVAGAVGAGCLVVLVVLAGLMAALLIPVLTATKGTARRVVCQNNLKQIGLALHNYYADHGTFPPAYVTDKAGNPMHSWRVQLLPYLERQDLYDQYDLSQPWNSPHNLLLAQQMPEIFACPDDQGNSPASQTSYMVVSGQGCLFDGNKEPTLNNLANLDHLIVIVEVDGSGVNWLEPKDLDAQNISFATNSIPGEIGSHHVPTAVNALLADGSVITLTPADAPTKIRAMCQTETFADQSN